MLVILHIAIMVKSLGICVILLSLFDVRNVVSSDSLAPSQTGSIFVSLQSTTLCSGNYSEGIDASEFANWFMFIDISGFVAGVGSARFALAF